jgi:hypothetical protein
MFTEKLDCEPLIGVAVAQSEPDEVRVIRHEHVSRTKQIVARAGVKENVPPVIVKGGLEPAGRAVFDGGRPEDEGAAAVGLGREAGKLAFTLTVGLLAFGSLASR